MRWPVPQSDPAAGLYQGTKGRDYHDSKRAICPDALPWVIGLRAEKFQVHVAPSAVVLELGVGSGWNLAGLRCARRMGIDAAPFLAEQVTSFGIEFYSDFRGIQDGIADVAICHHTLEHLLDPAEALRQMQRVLNPKGKLILHVPWEREPRYRRYQKDDPNHHLFNWNAQNLGNLVTVLGYRVEAVACRRYGYDRFAANLAVRFRVGEPGFRLLRRCLIALRPLLEVELIAQRSTGAA